MTPDSIIGSVNLTGPIKFAIQSVDLAWELLLLWCRHNVELSSVLWTKCKLLIALSMASLLLLLLFIFTHFIKSVCHWDNDCNKIERMDKKILTKVEEAELERIWYSFVCICIERIPFICYMESASEWEKHENTRWNQFCSMKWLCRNIIQILYGLIFSKWSQLSNAFV